MWYAKVEEPVWRSPSGIDTVDLVLDLVMAPDGSCRRKDEEDFAEVVARVQISAETARIMLGDAQRMAVGASGGRAVR